MISAHHGRRASRMMETDDDNGSEGYEDLAAEPIILFITLMKCPIDISSDSSPNKYSGEVGWPL